MGGVIFGAGFVMGGYCPGTSCVAAVSGKLDGLALMGGLLTGIALFNEAYPILESCYNATPLGTMTPGQLFGVSPNIVMTAIVSVAIAVFVIVGRMERRRIALCVEAGSTTPGTRTLTRRMLIQFDSVPEIAYVSANQLKGICHATPFSCPRFLVRLSPSDVLRRDRL